MSLSSGISSAFQFDEKRDYETRRNRKSRSNSQSSTTSISSSVSSNGSIYSSPCPTTYSNKPLPSLPAGQSSRRVHFSLGKSLPPSPPVLGNDDDFSHIGESRKRMRSGSEGDFAWWAQQQSSTRNESFSSEQQKEYFEKETFLGEGEQDVQRLQVKIRG